MTTPLVYHPMNIYIRKQFLVTTTAIALAGASVCRADTLNLDFQNNAGTIATAGILPAGPTWNEVTSGDSIFPARADDNQILPDTGAFTGGAGTSIEPGANDIQADSISGMGPGAPSVSITDLRSGDYYKIIVYNAQESGVSTATIAGGESKSIGPATNPATIAEMVEGLDYVIFDSVKAEGNSIGISMSHAILAQFAGMQIQGWFPQREFPHKTDLQISKKIGSGYKGDNQYGGSQKEKIKKKKKGKFYIRLQNDSTIGGTYGLRGKGSDRKAVRKYIDLSGGGNISASVKSGTYETGIPQTDHATILVKLKPKKDKRKAASVITGFPCDDPGQATDGVKAVLKK